MWSVGTLAPGIAAAPELAFTLAYAAVSLEILVLSALVPVFPARALIPVACTALAGLGLLAGSAAGAGPAALLTLALGAGTTVVGAALGARTEKLGQLVAVALVSGLADLWSVLDPGAPSARLAERAMAEPERLVLVALPFPLLGTELVPAVTGAGDVLFAALYVAAFRRHERPVTRVLLALALGFALGCVGLLLSERPLPLLPLLGGAVIASEPSARSLSAREWRTVLGVCAALLLAIALRAALSTSR